MHLFPVEEYYNELEQLAASPLSVRDSYFRLRMLAERLCKQFTKDEPVKFSNFFSRLSFICERREFSASLTFLLQSFRIRSNKMRAGEEEYDKKQLLCDIYSVAEMAATLYETTLSEELKAIAPSTSPIQPITHATDKVKRIRVTFLRWEEEVLIVNDEAAAHDHPVRVSIQSEVLEPFQETLGLLWEGAQLNLLNVYIDDAGVYSPEFIVLEPDYLINVSALAECYRDYGAHPLNYILSKFKPAINSRHILLGNTANLFLDELVSATETSQPSYNDTILKAFRQYPLEFSCCSELNDSQVERTFFIDAKQQFENIRTTIESFFQLNNGVASRVLIEPSFVCEALGVQGRLDLMLDDYSHFIELKSGKAEEAFPSKEFRRSKRNHYSQMLLYLAMLEFSMNVKHHDVKSYLLYSRYAALVPEQHSWQHVRQIIDLRNQIVACEYLTQSQNSIEMVRSLLNSITAERLNQKQLENKLWKNYLRREIDEFSHSLQNLSPLESDYLYALYLFITKEHYLGQAGDTDMESSRSVTYLWNATLDEKRAIGEILYDLVLTNNNAADIKPTITLFFPQYEEEYLPNFREGESVVLYQRNSDADKVTNRQVFKGTIEKIDPTSLTIRLRCRQKNDTVLPDTSHYGVEHDYMETTFFTMYRSLSFFMNATAARRALLLSQREPRFTKPLHRVAEIADDTERAVEKALAAQDYFLLLGPPGTGKTSRALKLMIERLLNETTGNILLLSYTNRAVDEMCKTLVSVRSDLPFVRIGGELSCESTFRSHLIEEVIANCRNRREVRETLSAQRIFVGTVASVASKSALFQLKHFDIAIIDEASQILEPHLLGVLTMRNEQGIDVVRRFVMIGDHKQLPAVVLQSETESEVSSELLKEAGITNFTVSLFERLYRTAQLKNNEMCYDMLRQQGRMHPEVAEFPNHYFYQGKLGVIPLEHQQEELLLNHNAKDSMQAIIATKRMHFFASSPNIHASSFKSNEEEAIIVGNIVAAVYEIYRLNDIPFDPDLSLGIITPYRTQIALIRKRLHQLQIPDADRIVIDTVERFQGGQRDIIIYSFCVNTLFQLGTLVNNMEEDGMLIDRKLNVALTRARKQMFLVGAPALLKRNTNFALLLEHIERAEKKVF